MEKTDASLARSARSKSAFIGLAVGIAGALFVSRALVRNWGEVSEATSNARPALLLLALVLGGLGMTGIGLSWHHSLRNLGTRLPLISSLRGFFVGQLGKYVPGGVWAIMGQGEWARGEGAAGAVAYTSVLLATGSVYLAALVLMAALVPVSGLLSADGGARYFWVLILLPLGFAVIHPRVLRAILKWLRRLTSREFPIVVPTWRASSVLVLQQLPTWLFIGAASFTLAAAFGNSGDAVNVILATIIAWIIGFLALPTPAGIGVREAVFIALATSLPTGVAATVAVVARLVFITVDAAAAGIITLLLARRNRRTKALS